MWIKSVRIDRFGCFREQNINDLSPGINVMVGPQRAGKTTLATCLTHLGYPIPEGGTGTGFVDPGEPGPLEAEVDVEGSTYRLTRRDRSEPVVGAVDDVPDRGPGELYNGLSLYEYRHLFSLHLDELRRVESVGDPGGIDQLQAVLIGEDWEDVARLPRMTREFDSMAESIGGKQGGATHALKPPLETIRNAVQERRELMERVRQRPELRRRKKERDERIERIEQELERDRKKQQRLSVVEECYEDFSEYRRLKTKLERTENRNLLEQYPNNGFERAVDLKEEFDEALDQLREARNTWQEKAGADAGEKLRRRLLENRQELEQRASGLDRLEEEVQSFRERRAELRMDENELKQGLRSLREEWEDHPEKLESIPVGENEEKKLADAVERFLEVKQQFDEHAKRLNSIHLELDRLQAQSDSVERPDLTLWAWELAGSLLIMMIGGYLGFSWNVWVGLSVTVLSGGFGVYALVRTIGAWSVFQDQSEMGPKIRNLRKEKEQLEETKPRVEKSREEAQQRLDEVKDDLGIPGDVSARNARTFYERAGQLRENWVDLSHRRAEIDQRRRKLIEQLEPLAETCRTVLERDVDRDEMIRDVENLVGTFRRCVELLEELRELNAAKRRFEGVKDRVTSLMAEEETDPDEATEKDVEEVREAFHSFLQRGERYRQLSEQRREKEERAQVLVKRLEGEKTAGLFEEYRPEPDDEDGVLDAFERACGSFSSLAELRQERESVGEDIASRREERDRVRDERDEIERKLEALNPSETLRSIHRKLVEGRGQLRPLAEEYAITRVAQVLSERLYDRFIERTYGEVLRRAGEIMDRLTGGEYVEIQPSVDSTGDEFQVLNSRDENVSSSSLSRATREQLFASLRLARIGEIHPPLPVIMDEVAANFDPSHRRRLARVLEELGTTHQVFFFTSQPGLVDELETCDPPSRFWALTPDHHVRGPTDDPEPVREWLEGNEPSVESVAGTPAGE